LRQYRKTVRNIIRSGLGPVDGMSVREFDALVAAKILKKMTPHIPGHCEHCGGRFSYENICTGCGLANGPQLATTPRGLEQLDRDEILRLKYLGMLSSDPTEHFLGSDMERTFGKEDGLVPEKVDTGNGWRARWERVNGRDKTVRCPVPVEGHHRTQESWRTVFYEIGHISDRLSLPHRVRDEMAHIYTNMRNSGATISTGIRLEKQLAKATYLACLVHRLSRKREDLEHDIRELYGFGIGEIPKEFVKAANFGHIRFGIEKKNKKQYLRTWKVGKRGGTDHKILGRL